MGSRYAWVENYGAILSRVWFTDQEKSITKEQQVVNPLLPLKLQLLTQCNVNEKPSELPHNPGAATDSLLLEQRLKVRTLHTHFFCCLGNIPVITVQRTQQKSSFQWQDSLFAQ